MRNAIGKFLLLVAVGVVAIACKDNKPKTPSTYKIEVNVPNGESYVPLMDSVVAFYYDKNMDPKKTIFLQKVPYNKGNFVFELLDTIQNKNLKTIVEYYKPEQIGDSAVISDKTALIAPIGIKGSNNGIIQGITFNPLFTVTGAMFSSGIYVHSDKNCEVTMDKKIGPKRYIFNLKLVKGYNLIQTIQSVENGIMKEIITTEQQGKPSWSVWK